jgi:2-(1,2-epoxy-1,2-dihydrophenyl)acetyl-CoA isomerase
MTQDTYEAFDLDIADGIAHITMKRPDTGNRFDRALNREISLVATECDQDPSVRCVLITSTGRFFSVGADLETFTESQHGFGVFIKNATAGLNSGISRLARMDAPVVIAVHALAVGGSVALSAAADFCLAGRSAGFYAAYTGIGMIPDGAATYYLPRRVGTRRAAEFLMLNQRWTAEEAEQHGLVNRVVEDDALEDEAWALARQIAAGPTKAYGEIKNLLLSTWEQPLEAQLEQEARAMARATQTADGWAGVQAVARKEQPVFEGR